MTILVDQPIAAALTPHPPRALVGLLGAGKTAQLKARLAELLRAGQRSERVLVLVANFAEATAWKLFVREFDFPHGEIEVFTFRAWTRRELLLNWPLVESSGLLKGPPKLPDPFLTGITAAQQLLRDIVEGMLENHPVLERCYTIPSMRLIQVLDTYARLVEAGLPFNEAARMLDRGHWLSDESEALHQFVGEAIAQYREFCFTHRVLDHTAQLELFHRALWGSARYKANLAKQVDWLIVDNLEETLPVAQEVIAALLPTCQGVLLARDLNGGLREYLGADPVGADQLIEKCAVETFAPIPENCPHAALGDSLARAVLAGPEAPPPAPVPGLDAVLHDTHTLRVQMFEAVGKRLRALIAAGTPPGEIVVIAPVVDPLLSWHLRVALAGVGKPLRVLSGSNRVIDHRPVRILVTLARLARPVWQVPPPEQDVVELLETLLALHPLEGPHLQQLVYGERSLLAPDEVAWPRHLEGRREAYGVLFNWITAESKKDDPLDRLFENAFANLYAPRRLRAMAPDEEQAGQPVASPYTWQADEALEVLQIDQLIQGARGYRQLASAVGLPSDEVPKRFLRSIYAGELAERPLIPRGTLPEAITLYTAAKYAEEGPKARYQLWVDAASPQWWKSDIRELMNPRVLTRRWAGGAYGDEHDQRHQAEKLARTLHTITLKCTGRLEVFASDYGSDGSELGGELAYWLAELLTEQRPAGGPAKHRSTGNPA